jgi:hypothetical protein
MKLIRFILDDNLSAQRNKRKITLGAKIVSVKKKEYLHPSNFSNSYFTAVCLTQIPEFEFAYWLSFCL